MALRDRQLTLHEEGSRSEWKLPYAAIEPPPPTESKAASAPAPQPARPNRGDFRCGEKVAFEDRYLQTQVGTIVRVNQRIGRRCRRA